MGHDDAVGKRRSKRRFILPWLRFNIKRVLLQMTSYLRFRRHGSDSTPESVPADPIPDRLDRPGLSWRPDQRLEYSEQHPIA